MTNHPTNSLYSLKLRSILTGLRHESIALWALCFYILMEYIRPQAMYPVLDIVPWGQVAIIACVVSVFVTGSKAIGFGVLDKMFIAFSFLVIMSGVFAWSPQTSLESWSAYASWILLYFCAISILTTPNRIFLFTLFFILINFKLSQHGARTFAMRGFSFTHWGLSGSPGWFKNSGEFALQMVVIFSLSLSVLMALREYVEKNLRWWILVFLFPGTSALVVIGSSSRGGQLAFVTVAALFFLTKGKNVLKKILIIAVLAYVGFNVLPEKQMERLLSIGEDETSQLRLLHWENAIETIEKNPMGIGYRNWGAYYAENYEVDRVEQIHNSVLEAFVDLGYLGGTLFLLMVLSAFIMNIRTMKEMRSMDEVEGKSIAAIAEGVNLGLLGTFIAGLFMSVLFYPMFWLAFVLTSALRHISIKKINALQSIEEGTPSEPIDPSTKEKKSEILDHSSLEKSSNNFETRLARLEKQTTELETEFEKEHKRVKKLILSIRDDLEDS